VVISESGRISSFETEILINSAGLYADRIAELAGIRADDAQYRIYPCKGKYYNINNRRDDIMVDRLIYPVPHLSEGGLGIHITMDMHGAMRFGPDSTYVDKIDYVFDDSRDAFCAAVKRYLPAIRCSDLEPGMVGVRPKLQKYGGDFRDFVVKHEADRGFPNFINLVGIESPGLTSSPAIARYVKNLIDQIM
jgi:L-2-hydroxyglutarate oxidase LhgO